MIDASVFSFSFLVSSKTTQRNKQIAMGRKKFNMDPKKVRADPRALEFKFKIPRTHSSAIQINRVKYLFCLFIYLFFETGNPVSFGERSSPEHPGGHCTVPLQRRRAQQNSHRGLLRGTVSCPVFSLFSFHLSFSSPHLCVRSTLHVLRRQ